MVGVNFWSVVAFSKCDIGLAVHGYIRVHFHTLSFVDRSRIVRMQPNAFLIFVYRFIGHIEIEQCGLIIGEIEVVK